MKNKIPKIIFSDFDGTLTDHTEFSSKFLEILELSKKHSIPFVIVTGRSISWAHFFLTHFSFLNYVISEGGGATSYKDHRGIIINNYHVDKNLRDKLENVSRDIVKKFDGLQLSSDSIGRVCDRAIELCDLSDPNLLANISKYLKESEINFSTSNVHLNFWAGNLSKYNAVCDLMKNNFPNVDLSEVIYFGDSLNDQSMFEKVEHSVGVANIKDVLGRMEHKPKVILTGDDNKGPSGVLNYLKNIFQS